MALAHDLGLAVGGDWHDFALVVALDQAEDDDLAPPELHDDYHVLRERLKCTPLQVDEALRARDEASADMSPLIRGLGDDAVRDYLYLRNGLGWDDAAASKAVGADRTQLVPFHRRDVEPFKEAFVNEIYPAVLRSQEETGIPAAVTAAQAIQESSFGTRVPRDVNTHVDSHNLFGIKAGRGDDHVTDWTQEYEGGQSNRTLGDFAACDSDADSMAAHGKFLQDNQRYAELFDNLDPESWARGLARYATDPGYADYLIDVMKSWNLIRPK